MPIGTDCSHVPTPVDDAHDIQPSWRQSRAFSVVGVVVGAVAFALASYYVATKVIDGLRQLGDLTLQVRILPATISLALVLICVLSGSLLWKLVLAGLGARVTMRECLHSHLLANLGGYLPGYGWKYVGKGYLTQRAGVPAGTASLAVLTEFGGLALTRTAVALTTLPATFAERLGLPPIVGFLRLAGWVPAAAAPWILVAVVSRVRRGNPGRWPGVQLDIAALYLALAVMCLNWVLYGIGFAFIVEAVQIVSLSEFPTILFATTSSFLVSLVLFFIPAGLAVRESVVIFVLEGVLSGPVVTAAALLSRLILVIVELLGALLGVFASRRRPLCR